MTEIEELLKDIHKFTDKKIKGYDLLYNKGYEQGKKDGYNEGFKKGVISKTIDKCPFCNKLIKKEMMKE